MRRGEIRLVDFDPAMPTEAGRRRPAVIVSNEDANSAATALGRGVLTVVPLTSNVTRVYPFQVFLPAQSTGLTRDSKAQAEQVRSISLARIGEKLARLTEPELRRLDEALRLHLAL